MTTIAELAAGNSYNPRTLKSTARRIGVHVSKHDDLSPDEEKWILTAVGMTRKQRSKLRRRIRSYYVTETQPAGIIRGAQPSDTRMTVSSSDPAKFSDLYTRLEKMQARLRELDKHLKGQLQQPRPPDSSSQTIFSTLVARLTKLEESLGAPGEGLDRGSRLSPMNPASSGEIAPTDPGKLEKKIIHLSRLLSQMQLRLSAQTIELAEQVVAVERDLHAKSLGVDAELEKLRESFASLSEQMGELWESTSFRRKEFERAEELREDISREAEQSITLDDALVEPTVEECVSVLADHKVIIDSELAEQCIGAVRRGKPILFVGEPGTGKTCLAQALPYVFFPGAAGDLLSDREARDNWQAFHVLGEEWIRGGQIVPELGCFSKAVRRCITSKGRHWLLINELNRAKPDRAFSGMLDILGGVRPTFLTIPAFGDRLRIPASFRLLCTMNDSQGFPFFGFSDGLMDRFERISLRPPTADTEERIIREVALGHVQQEASSERYTSLLEKLLVSEELTRSIARYLDFASRTRGLAAAHRDGAWIITLRHTVNVFERAAEGYCRHPDRDIAALVDTELANEARNVFFKLQTNLLDQVAETAIDRSSFPKTHDLLAHESHRRSLDIAFGDMWRG